MILTSEDKKVRLELSSHGAAVTSLWKSERQVIGAPDEYSGVLLFPWPNRIYEGSWFFRGEHFQLDVNDIKQNSALHGLVSASEFELKDSSSSHATYSLNFQKTKGYPFEPKLTARYSVTNCGLDCDFEISNPSEFDIPFAFGFHPYFLADEAAKFSSDGGNFYFQNEDVDKTLQTCGEATVLETNDFRVSISSSELMYTHIFVNRYSEPGKVWFAIEPQSATANSLNDLEQTIVLQPGQTITFSVQVVID